MAATNGSGRYAQWVLHCMPLPKEVHRVPLGSTTVGAYCSLSSLVSQCSCLSKTFEVHRAHTRWNYDLKILLKGYYIRLDHSKE
jgi:hypothetical protein